MSERLREHYNNKHADDLGAEALPLIPWDLRWPTNRIEAALFNLRERIPPGARILEVGAGDGSLAESLRTGGAPFASYTVLELSDVRLEGLRRHLRDERYEFVVGDVEDIEAVVSEAVDVVIMVALIEHLIDPMGTMQKISKLLRAGGFAYVDTPNFAKWTRRVRLLAGRFPSTSGVNEGLTTYKGSPATMYDEGHLHYFTYRSLSLMLTERCGFDRTERLGYFEGPKGIPIPIGHPFARVWPAMFGELAIAAYV